MKKLFIASSIVFLANASIVFAAGIVPACEGVQCTICDLVKLGHNVINYGTQLAFALAVGMIVYGGYIVLMAGGSEEKVTKGRKVVWSSAIGITIVLTAWIVVNTVLQILVGNNQLNTQKFPWPWNNIPEDCGNKPAFPAVPAGSGSQGGENGNATYSGGGGGVNWEPAPNPAGALEPQGPVGPNGQAPTAPAPGEQGAPEIQGPSRDLMSPPAGG